MRTEYSTWRVLTSTALALLAVGILANSLLEVWAGKLAQSPFAERNAYLLFQILMPGAMLVLAWKLLRRPDPGRESGG